MSTLLVKHASILVTMDDAGREIADGALFARDGFIEQVGSTRAVLAALAARDERPQETLDLSGHVVLPGLVNTHHHFCQTLTRAVPAAQNANLFHWLTTLYPIWARLRPEDIFIATQTALAELALSGCTTTADHLYLFPNGSRLDDEIAAAREMGLRLHASRGAMSLGTSRGGLPPDTLVEDETHILNDSQRLIQQYHDPRPGSYLHIVLAPCSPFSVTPDLMREAARLARQYGVRLHTHLAETEDEEVFCQQRFGQRPVAYMRELGWLGEDVWFAHAIYVNRREVRLLARYGCGVAHCPTSNMRLASGIAPVREYLAAGVHVGLGVDGSASNDSSHMLAEARQAFLLARLKEGITGFSLSSDPNRSLLTARQALLLATRGGAAVLGRSDIGSLEVGKCADFCAIRLDRLDYAGALHDPVAAVVFCHPPRVDYTVVGGRFVVREGQLVVQEEAVLVARHNRAAQRLVAGS